MQLIHKTCQCPIVEMCDYPRDKDGNRDLANPFFSYYLCSYCQVPVLEEDIIRKKELRDYLEKEGNDEIKPRRHTVQAKLV